LCLLLGFGVGLGVGFGLPSGVGLYELLRSQGMQDNQQVVFLIDGGEDVRDIPATSIPRPSTASTGSTSPCA
jgi:hypothetical protein